MITKIFLALLGFLAIALSTIALYFTILPVLSIMSWGWWSILLIPASWVAAFVMALVVISVGALMISIAEEPAK
jgi:hypothetical protein